MSAVKFLTLWCKVNRVTGRKHYLPVPEGSPLGLDSIVNFLFWVAMDNVNSGSTVSLASWVEFYS